MLQKYKRVRSNLDDLLITHYKSPQNKRNLTPIIRKFGNNNLDTKSSQNTYVTDKSNYSKKSKISRLSKSLINSPRNSYYNLICRNCYNRRLNTQKFSRDLNNPSQKEKLNLTFNRINPYYFYDKMERCHNDKKQDKVKNREEITKKVINNLEEIKRNNPSQKENLQYNNEYSPNGLNFNPKKDPRYEKVKNNYDLKEKILQQQRNLYNINYNEPRKAIKEYYDKIMYEIPVQEPKYEMSNEVKKNYITDLKNQIIEKEEYEKNEKRIEKEIENKANENYNRYLNDKLFHDRLKKMEEQKRLKDYNEKMINLKKEKEEEEKNYKKDFQRRLSQRIKRENDEEYYNKMLTKIKNIEQMKNWMNEAMDKKIQKKKEEEKEKEKWKNYSEEFEIKCQHGNNIYRCSICNRIYPKDQLIRVRTNFLHSKNSNF